MIDGDRPISFADHCDIDKNADNILVNTLVLMLSSFY